MKFSAKTVMKTATFRDLSLGRAQGTLVEDPFSGYIIEEESNWATKYGLSSYHQKMIRNLLSYFFFIGTVLGMCGSCYLLFMVSKETNYYEEIRGSGSTMKMSLLDADTGEDNFKDEVLG